MPRIEECLETNILWLVMHDECDEALSLIEKMNARELRVFYDNIRMIDRILTEYGERLGGMRIDGGQGDVNLR